MSGFVSGVLPLTEFVFVQWIITWTRSAYGVRMWAFGTHSVHTEEWLCSKEATLCPCWSIPVLHSRNALAPSMVLALFHVKFACSHLDCVGFLLGNLNIFPLATNTPAWSLFFPLYTCVYRWIVCIPCNGGLFLGSIAPRYGITIGWEKINGSLILSCTGSSYLQSTFLTIFDSSLSARPDLKPSEYKLKQAGAALEDTSITHKLKPICWLWIE